MSSLCKWKYLQLILDIYQDNFAGIYVQELWNLLQAHSEIKSDTSLIQISDSSQRHSL